MASGPVVSVTTARRAGPVVDSSFCFSHQEVLATQVTACNTGQFPWKPLTQSNLSSSSIDRQMALPVFRASSLGPRSPVDGVDFADVDSVPGVNCEAEQRTRVDLLHLALLLLLATRLQLRCGCCCSGRRHAVVTVVVVLLLRLLLCGGFERWLLLFGGERVDRWSRAPHLLRRKHAMIRLVSMNSSSGKMTLLRVTSCWSFARQLLQPFWLSLSPDFFASHPPPPPPFFGVPAVLSSPRAGSVASCSCSGSASR